jgi:hypothetical protein
MQIHASSGTRTEDPSAQAVKTNAFTTTTITMTTTTTTKALLPTMSLGLSGEISAIFSFFEIW